MDTMAVDLGISAQCHLAIAVSKENKVCVMICVRADWQDDYKPEKSFKQLGLTL